MPFEVVPNLNFAFKEKLMMQLKNKSIAKAGNLSRNQEVIEAPNSDPGKSLVFSQMTNFKERLQ